MNVREIFDSMEYGTAPESPQPALDWIAARGGIAGPWIGGKWGPARDDMESRNPASGERLAGLTKCTAEEVQSAVAAARKAQPGWARSGGKARARVLYAIARIMQKNARLLAVMESLDNGKPIRESRDIDVPLAIRHFYYHAGLAQLFEAEMPGREAHGVCGQIIPWNFPLLMLAWKIAPALAAGNAVVLKPAEYTTLSAMVFAEICAEAGVPPGVVNIVTGDGETGAALVAAEVDKIAFTGSTAVGRVIREATAGRGIPLTLELGGKSPYIVFDDADLDSAVEGLVDAIWFNQGQVCCAGSRLLVQEGVAEEFHARLKARMAKLRIGDPLDKSVDVGAIVDPVQLQTISALVDSNTAGEVYQPVKAPQGCFYPPTLITGLHPSDPLMQEEIFGPVLVATTFRTPSEAVEIANNTRYGLAATVWTENLNLALDMAPKLAAGVVWVNGTNMFDAAAGFGGVRESGFGREGGWEGLLAYTRLAGKAAKVKPVSAVEAPARAEVSGLDRTAKLYVGGKQARPDGGYSRAIWSPKGRLLGHAGLANRKDVRNAVEAARAAKGWARNTAHGRAQVLYYIAENLEARAGEFAARLCDMTGATSGKAKAEVAEAVDTLFTFAAWADKYDGAAKPVPLRGVALAMHEPVGVIGALCADDAPLAGLVRAMAPAIAMGNACVLVASQPFPLAATDFYQVLDTSDVPGGVVNILTGDHAELAPVLAAHSDVDAVWSFSGSDLSEVIERGSAGNLKRTWVNDGRSRDWPDRGWLAQATEVKTIWVPYGE